MDELFSNLGLKRIIHNEKESVFTDKIITLKCTKPSEATNNAYLIQIEYQKVFLGWDSAWYKREYPENELVNHIEEIIEDIEIIRSNYSKAVYIDHLMKVEGFEDWWKTNVEFIEGLLCKRVRD